jgi:phenylacetate-CoA ligase
MYVHASNILYLSSYNINKDKSILYYKEIKQFEPKAIEGYPSSLYNLGVFLKEADLKLNIPLAFTSSETLYEFQRELIEDILGTKIYDRYGCTEKTISIAQKQNKQQEYYEEPGYSINEYNKDSIFTTSLINDVFPLIRYEVNDIVETKNTFDGFAICSISGRKEDMIVCKDGSLIGRIDHVFKGVNNIKFAQIIQNHSGGIIVNIVPEKNYSLKDKQLIIENIYHKMGKNNIDITINIISEKEIIYTSRNKFKLVISNI